MLISINIFKMHQRKGFFYTRNSRGDEDAGITLHSATYNNILRNLDRASEFF